MSILAATRNLIGLCNVQEIIATQCGQPVAAQATTINPELTQHPASYWLALDRAPNVARAIATNEISQQTYQADRH